MQDENDNSIYKIIVVDDSDFSRSLISNILTTAGYNVMGECASAKEALDVLKDRSAHIAIIDIVMPEVSGIELAETLHSIFKEMSIIMVSSLAQENIIIDAISAGAADFIQKPFTKEILLNSVEKLTSAFSEESA